MTYQAFLSDLGTVLEDAYAAVKGWLSQNVCNDCDIQNVNVVF